MVLDDIIRHPHIRLFFEAWKRARQGQQGVPAKRHFDPLDCPAALSKVWIYKQCDGGAFQCILVGEEIASAWQKSIKGKAIPDIIGHPDYRIVEQRLRTVLENSLVAHGIYENATRQYVVAERLFAPLTDSSGRNRYVIGASVYKFSPYDRGHLRTVDLAYYDLSYTRVDQLG